MNRDYSEFSVIDFIEDPFFRQWVDENSIETNRFWGSFVAEHPDKKVAIEEARAVLILMMKLPERNLTPRMEAEANEIKKNVDKAIHYPFMHASEGEGNYARMTTPAELNMFSIKRLSIAASFILAVVVFVAVTVSRDGGVESIAEAQTIVQTCAKGKRLLITLPDQTKVWLNSGSQLIYSRGFNDQDTREVFLAGEAFFDVVEDKSRPFIVNTSSIAIRVLGTEFNVRSYDDDKTVEATLVRGKIAIGMVEGEGGDRAYDQASLVPNQRAVFIKKTKKLVLQNDIEAEIYAGWRTGKLYFDDKPVTEVLAMIERWYNVSIHLETIPSTRCTFSAKMDNKTLAEVLDLFKASADDSITYSIKDRDVYIKGKFCE